MTSYLDSIRTAVRQSFCALTSVPENFAAYLDQLDVPDVSGARGNFRNLYRAVCNVEPPDPPPLECPQGQCDNVLYQFRFTYRYRDNPQQGWTSGNFQIVCPSGLFGPLSPPYVMNVAGQLGIFINARSGVGTAIERRGPYGVQYPIVNFPQAEIEVLSYNYERCDGEEDNCGECTSIQPSPGWNSTDINLTYEDNSQNTYSFPIDITLEPPQINLNGDIIAPFTFITFDAQLNVPVEFVVELNLSTGDVTFDFSPTSGQDGREDKQPTKYENDDDPPDGNDNDGTRKRPVPDNPETERVIRAVIVTTVEDESQATVIQQTSPAPLLRVPDVGNVSFLCRGGNNIVGWTTPQRVQSHRAFIPCEWEGGAIDVVFNSRPGVTAVVTKVWRRVDRAREDS